MNLKLKASEIAKAVNGEIIAGDGNIKIKNIITDSRKILPESLFFAFKGEAADGHDFAEKALQDGALGAVMQKDSVKIIDLQNKNSVIITVEDTIQALLDTAKYYKNLFKNLNITLGITGSVGKTTAKEFIYSVLNQKFKTQKSEGNFNTEVGLPMTLFGLEEDTRAIVLEMGMSGFGEISRLSKTANPDIAVITTIGTSHIEKLGSREGIKKAKFEILDGMDFNSNIILNADCDLLYSEKNKTGRKEFFFGVNNKDAGFTAENINLDYEKNISEFSADNFKFVIPAVGLHNIYNALPAIITGKIYGLSNEEIQNGFNNFRNAKMRQNIYDFNDITIIEDCYNASLESVRAALGVLAGMAAKSKERSNLNFKPKSIAVLSDVLESGDYSEMIHKNIGEEVVNKNIDIAFICGEKSKVTHDTIKQRGKDKRSSVNCMYFNEKSEIANALYKMAKRGDVILFKASRGMELETVIDDFKKKFD